jgi:hypothetical protein
MKKFFKKKNLRKFHAILFVLIALFLIVSGSVLRNVKLSRDELGAAALYAQVTPTPQAEDASEIGSTDGIVLMGIIIMLIVIVPILLQRKSWSDG